MARLADFLTGSRIAVAAVMPAIVGSGALDWAAVVVTMAWVTDFLDGRFARAASTQTKLDTWDFAVDAFLGIGILVGLGLGGYAPWWQVLLVLGVFGGGWIVLKNPAPAMLLLAYTYAWFLALLWIDAALVTWLPFAWIVFSTIASWRRLTRIIFPAFFKGLASLWRGENPDTLDQALDDWA